jgi:hypothetical protein
MAAPAHAAVPGPGPVADINGSSFPSFYQDANGLQLRPCLNALHCGATTAADVANPDGEFFYNLVEADVGPWRVVIGLEGAFLAEGVGQEQTFNRLRFRAPDPGDVKGSTTYTIVHPYGTTTVRSRADGSARSQDNNEDDEGCEVAPCDFGAAMPGGLLHAPYTRFLTAAGDTGADGFADNDGVAGPIVGSPTGNNFVKIYEGTAATGTPVWSETRFTVQAAVAAPGQTPPPQNPPPTPVVTAPSAPAKPAVTAGTPGGVATITVNWAVPTAGGAPTSYTVETYRIVSGRRVLVDTEAVDGSPTSLSVSGLVTNAKYVARVQATNSAGTSAFSPFSSQVRPR